MSSPSRQPRKRPESSVNSNSVRQVDQNNTDGMIMGDPRVQIKRPRLMPNLVSQPQSTSNLTPTTDESTDEEIECSSPLPKSTIKTIGKANSSCENISDSDCDSDCSSNTFGSKERSYSSSFHYMDSNLSDTSTSLNYMAEKTYTMRDKVLGDNGHSPNNSDVQLTKATTPKTNLPLPARFKTCVQCRKQNDDPYFQFCNKCFKFRKEFFKNNRYSKQKRIRCTREKSVLKHSQESSSGLSCELLSQKEKFNSNNTETGEAEENKNLCNICFIKPKNGIFNHGNIGHIYCCYSCAKRTWKKSYKCPLCNTKIKFVTKLLTE